MLEFFSTSKEITIGADGEPKEERELEDDFKLKKGTEAAGGEGESRDRNSTFLEDLKKREAAKEGITKITVKVSRIVDA
jgi:hypothetical protein